MTSAPRHLFMSNNAVRPTAKCHQQRLHPLWSALLAILIVFQDRVRVFDRVTSGSLWVLILYLAPRHKKYYLCFNLWRRIPRNVTDLYPQVSQLNGAFQFPIVCQVYSISLLSASTRPSSSSFFSPLLTVGIDTSKTSASVDNVAGSVSSTARR